MKVALLYLSLCVFHTFRFSDTNKEAVIQITPNRAQFFQYEDLSLTCEFSAGGGRPKRNTTIRGTELCSYGWGTLKGSNCTINTVYPPDSGLYWCESDSGEQSQTVHIKVTGGSVILESPALPVTEGDDVTLRCTTRSVLSNLQKVFYKDGLFIWSNFTKILTIHGVSKSDEGLYKCSISGAGESAESWLSVRESDRAFPDGPDAPTAPVLNGHRLICHVVVGTPYLLATIILVLIYRDKRRALRLVAEDRSNTVVMEA